MKNLPTLLILALAATLPFTAQAKKKKKNAEEPIEQTNLAVYLLKQLNEREEEAYDRYETAVAEEDVDQVRRELQSIINGYEKLIASSPDYAPAYVSYGLMLNRTGNRDAANAIFLKADELDPMVPVVKNQLGNFMAEEGKYTEALGFFMLARDLAPEEALYQYQIGNLLVAYRKFFVGDGLYAAEEIDDHIINHFQKAYHLNPGEISYKMRYAQAFFDVDYPDWETALVTWQELYRAAGSEYEEQVVKLYIARVRFEMGHHTAARKLIKQIDHPSLDESKKSLLGSINAEYPQ
ncbi:hypothetical protein [Pelagicoccus mobilis]|uniref:Tetratricopeptide repeat protein n=1 Tax=Pelagicoccus mobilis TaxID=415221 RepID=A0A934RXS8_9BACT|nr:hypothetical protein [Pelagicoccus mobilis]MBK1878293.1 hypothetical protein [Pelagicoccus mobilis]